MTFYKYSVTVHIFPQQKMPLKLTLARSVPSGFRECEFKLSLLGHLINQADNAITYPIRASHHWPHQHLLTAYLLLTPNQIWHQCNKFKSLLWPEHHHCDPVVQHRFLAQQIPNFQHKNVVRFTGVACLIEIISDTTGVMWQKWCVWYVLLNSVIELWDVLES